VKVLLINGSPHAAGCTFTALSEIADTLNSLGIDSEIFHIGTAPISGCLACGGCAKLKKCVIDDVVNVAAEKVRECDGIIVGSPVHYAGASGAVVSFLDRLSYSAGSDLRAKPGAAIVSARRAGTTAALDQLNKYFNYAAMPLVGSTYWNMVHGAKPEDVRRDEEGLQTMRNLARSMAWLLKCIDAGDKAGVPRPEFESGNRTNFIR